MHDRLCHRKKGIVDTLETVIVETGHMIYAGKTVIEKKGKLTP